MFTANIFEKREVNLDSPFMKDSEGNLYRLFASPFTGTLSANIITADFKEFKRDTLVSSAILDSLKPIDQKEYIHAAVENAKLELGQELAAATGGSITSIAIRYSETPGTKTDEAENNDVPVAADNFEYIWARRRVWFFFVETLDRSGLFKYHSDARKEAEIISVKVADYLYENNLLSRKNVDLALEAMRRGMAARKGESLLHPETFIEWIEEGLRHEN